MSSATLQKTQGFVSAGSGAPFFNPNALVIVGLDEPDSDNNWYARCTRLSDEKDSDLSGYVADIMRSGVVDKVVQGCRDGNRIIVLDGRRTTRSARIAWAAQAKAGVRVDERVKIRVAIHADTADDWFRINVESHKAKPLTPLQHASGYLHLWKRFGEDHKRVAELYGVTVQTVKNQLAVFSVSEKVQQLFDVGKFPLRELVKTVNLPREAQDAMLEKMEAVGDTRGAAAANAIRAVKAGREVVADKSKMRSRVFLERWLPQLKKVDVVHRREIDPVDLLKFILGGPVPRGLDEQVRASLEAAGFKKPREGLVLATMAAEAETTSPTSTRSKKPREGLVLATEE